MDRRTNVRVDLVVLPSSGSYFERYATTVAAFIRLAMIRIVLQANVGETPRYGFSSGSCNPRFGVSSPPAEDMARRQRGCMCVKGE